MNKIKPLTIEETSLKEEMKSRCLNKGQYIDEKAKDKFKMLCHLEDFEVQYWELKDRIDKAIEYIEQLGVSDWRCFGRKILLETLKGNKETPDLFKGVKTITEIPPVPKNMDTSHLQEFIDELKGDKE